MCAELLMPPGVFIKYNYLVRRLSYSKAYTIWHDCKEIDANVE